MTLANGPYRTLAVPFDAAMQLSHCGHSSFVLLQHSDGLIFGQRLNRHFVARASIPAIFIHELIY